MNEIFSLLQLSWLLATVAPGGTPADGTALAVSSLPEPPALEGTLPGLERERRSRMSCLLGPEMPRLAGLPDGPQIPNNPALTDTWFFGLGATFMNSNTQAELKSSAGAGAVIDFEDAFGLAENDWAPEGLARWRFSDRWRVELEYFSLNRSNTRTTTQDINWGNNPTIPAGTVATGKFDVSVLRVSCGYSFFKTQDKELGVALGFHVTTFDAGISTSSGSLGDAKVLAPLPVASFYGQFALTDEWSVGGRLDALRLEYAPFYGNVLSVGVDTLYQPWRHWGFGLGWRTLQIAGGVSSSDWEGSISTTYTGPIAYITSSF